MVKEGVSPCAYLFYFTEFNTIPDRTLPCLLDLFKLLEKFWENWSTNAKCSSQMPQDDGTYNKDAAEKQYTIYAQKDNSERNDRKSKF